MAVTIPQIRVGEPIRHQALSVFPLFKEGNGQVDYVLSDEALEAETITVEEVDEDGSVPDLLVDNKGDRLVLFLEGEELIGAKQNRILNATVLVAAKRKMKIPVSCVEQGRWAYRSKRFQSSKRRSPSKLRHALNTSVFSSLKKKKGHRSDQGKVWEEVGALEASLDVSSRTVAMSETYEAYEQQVAEFREKIHHVEGASGVAVAIGGRIVALDLFDKPATCQEVWDRLLSGFVLDLLDAKTAEGQAEVSDVEEFVEALGDAPWEEVQAVGEGEESRAEAGDGVQASALSLGGSLVHASVVAGG